MNSVTKFICGKRRAHGSVDWSKNISVRQSWAGHTRLFLPIDELPRCKQGNLMRHIRNKEPKETQMDLKPRWLGQTIDAADIFSTYCTSESKNQDRLTNVSIICVRCETSRCFLGGMRSYLYHNKYEEPWQGSGCETVAIRTWSISRLKSGPWNDEPHQETPSDQFRCRLYKVYREFE
jgi:hypothetical protein